MGHTIFVTNSMPRWIVAKSFEIYKGDQPRRPIIRYVRARVSNPGQGDLAVLVMNEVL